MRILHICSRLPYPIEDGGSVYVYNSIKGLSDIGHDICIASFKSELHNQDVNGLTALGEVYYEDGKFTPYSFLAAAKSFSSRKVISIQHRMSKSIMSKIISRVDSQIDLVIFEGLHTVNFFDLVRQRFPKAKTLLRHVNAEFSLIYQNALNQDNQVFKWFLMDQANLMKKFELTAINKVDAVSFISKLDKISLLGDNEFSKPFIISPPGSNNNRIIEFSKREMKKLIAFSNWKWSPNLTGLKWFIDEVWKLILDQDPEIYLEIAGNDLPSNIITALPKNISYLGFVKDLFEFNSSAAIQIIPLKSGSGVKLKVIEGLSFGNPIVSTSFGVDGIEIESGKHFELANSPQEFSNKVLKLINDDILRKSISENAFRLITENYSWVNRINELDNFIQKKVM